jgi:hypothetical protein
LTPKPENVVQESETHKNHTKQTSSRREIGKVSLSRSKRKMGKVGKIEGKIVSLRVSGKSFCAI